MYSFAMEKPCYLTRWPRIVESNKLQTQFEQCCAFVFSLYPHNIEHVDIPLRFFEQGRQFPLIFCVSYFPNSYKIFLSY